MDAAERLLKGTPAALASEPVLFAYLFGSHAVGRARPDSDVDVAVFLDDQIEQSVYLDARLRLAASLADVTRLANIEVVVLNEAPLPLKGRIVHDGIIIFRGDEVRRVRFECATRAEFFDHQIRAIPLAKELLRGVAEGRR